MATEEFRSVCSLIYVGGGATDADMARWYVQGFSFATTDGGCSFGLRQEGGGPCGVLAAVQAEMVYSILFGPEAAAGAAAGSGLPQPSVAEVRHHLVRAMLNTLERAASSQCIRLVELVQFPGAFSESTTHLDLRVCTFTSHKEAYRHALSNLDMYMSSAGCMLFLMSLILTRTVGEVRAEMDAYDNTLLGPFGHCNQELINLLLTGRATTNVMDGDVPMGGGLVLRGVTRRSKIGYLTHLEALNLLEVGNYYKVPEHPIWVVGSSSHFSVLFATDRRVNEEDSSARLQATVLRVFKSIDSSECGFIPCDRLGEALRALELPAAQDETWLARLRGHLKIDGDIILWSSFWMCVSRLMVGASLDDVIESPVGVGDDVVMAGQETTGGGGARPRSDSDMARELQAELNGETLGGAGASSSGGNNMFVNGGSDSNNNNLAITFRNDLMDDGASGRPRSDSEIARAMQEEWNADDGVPGLLPAFPEPGGVPPLSNAFSPIASPAQAATAASAAPGHKLHRTDSIADESSEAMCLFHFNGLENAVRAASLKAFSVYLRKSVDTIGHNIGMAPGGASGGSCYLCPIEEVLRTRFPGCRLDWHGQAPPSID